MTSPGFRPTHVIPQDGLPAWEEPDPARPTVPLDPLLPVRLEERRGDWGRVLCANGWSAWVDGRLLIAVPQEPPEADAPPARTADPRPLLERAAQALAHYRAAVDELTGGGLDGEGFRERTHGMRVGVVVDGESVWLYDSDHGRWEYADGDHLTTFAADAEPRAADPDLAGPDADLASGGRGTTDVVGAASADGRTDAGVTSADGSAGAGVPSAGRATSAAGAASPAGAPGEPDRFGAPGPGGAPDPVGEPAAADPGDRPTDRLTTDHVPDRPPDRQPARPPSREPARTPEPPPSRADDRTATRVVTPNGDP